MEKIFNGEEIQKFADFREIVVDRINQIIDILNPLEGEIAVAKKMAAPKLTGKKNDEEEVT